MFILSLLVPKLVSDSDFLEQHDFSDIPSAAVPALAPFIRHNKSFQMSRSNPLSECLPAFVTQNRIHKWRQKANIQGADLTRFPQKLWLEERKLGNFVLSGLSLRGRRKSISRWDWLGDRRSNRLIHFSFGQKRFGGFPV